jgi:Phage tail tube protein, GTA-gp10
MSAAANSLRGEASILVDNAALTLRPSFTALVAAEEEIGPLFDLVERAADGRLKLSEMVALFWHCRHDAPASLTREEFGEAVAAAGLAAATPPLKILLGQILAGR